MTSNHSETESCLWGSADEWRAKPKLKRSEYPIPYSGLSLLRYEVEAVHQITTRKGA